jgi:uncharacterized protein (TIGR03084 family)
MSLVERLAADFAAECEALDTFLEGLSDDQWSTRTAFYDWTPRDQVLHLHFVDELGAIGLSSREAFAARVAEIRRGQAEGQEMSDQARARFGHLSMTDLRRAWRALAARLCATFVAADPKQRMPWFGPDMSVAAFASARQMEVWAHGQDIYDALAVRRPNASRLRNICDLGVRTFGWSFANRDLPPPGPAPEVRLSGPDGDTWIWNPGNQGCLSGSAEDFALIVTRRRAAADLTFFTAGQAARDWLPIAQCFAGPPEDIPAPGERVVAFADGTRL